MDLLYILMLVIGFLIGLLTVLLLKKNKKEESLKELLKKENIENQLTEAKKELLQLQKEREESLKELSKKENIENQLTEVKQEREQLQKKREESLKELSEKNTTLKHYKEKLEQDKEEISKLQEKFTTEFKNLANEILEDKSKKFTLKNKENIEQILNPLQEKIKDFNNTIKDTNTENIKRHTSLKEQINFLKNINSEMNQEAQNLTRALKGDSKIQGNWGELILETVLEKSGLRKGREYEMQKSVEIKIDENNKRLRPDVIINLPDNRKMIIDSKVSLIAYEKFANSEKSEDRNQFLKEHVTSLKNHIKNLSAKKYEDLYKVQSPDFVLLFIPIEPAFAVASEKDNQIYSDAFNKNIVIVTPTTLLATLRVIENLWRNEMQQQNAIDIANKAGALYDKFVSFTDDMIKVGKQMDTAKGTYEDAMNKLSKGRRGNLIYRAEELKDLGASAKKQINEKLLERSLD